MYTCFFTFVFLFCAISKTKASHDISLSIPQLNQYRWKNKYMSTKIYNFNFTENDAIITFDCVLDNPMQREEIYKLTFYLDNVLVRYSKVKVSKSNNRFIRNDMKINKESDNITCTAVPVEGIDDAPMLTNEIRLHYIPPTLNTLKETSTETSIDTSIGNHQRGWLIWVLGGCVIFLTICIAGCFAVLTCRQKKPLPVDPNYANLVKDQSYQTMPMPKLKSLQKPSDQTMKTAVDNTYNEMQSPPDISEVSYADPNWFLRESPYAEPSDTYAEPYVASSNETYAELYAPKDPYASIDSHAPNEPYTPNEPYAIPIPKAQRKPKIKDDDYSNVFGNQYANVKN